MTQLKDHYDVIVIGAGLSGIDAGYRLQTQCPDKDYVILEARESMGGTWDLFTYPGIRSDSDMYTLGFPFEPWSGEKSIADGADILAYVKATAAKYGIDQKIAYQTKVVRADWSTPQAQWTITVQTPDGERSLTAKFVYMCSGYYNYDEGYTPEFAGRDSFQGQIVHPQFWPEDFEAKGKNIVVIGSGATAMTLVPALVNEGAHVTMLQRSPTYVVNLPATDPIAHKLRGKMSPERAYNIVRWKNIVATSAFYQFARRMPSVASTTIRKGVEGQLKGSDLGMEHFTPSYKPWDQRLCIVPGGDLFKALRNKRATVVTDTINSFVPDGVKVSSGDVLPADVIVTATGLNMRIGGGADITIDGSPADLGSRYIYRGMMIEGLPNVAVCIGYTNASWTLRADLSSQYFCKFVNYVSDNGYAYGYPSFDPTKPMEAKPALDLTSGYVQRSIAIIPKQGDRRPWFLRQNYILDRRDTKGADVTQDMTFVRPGDANSVAAQTDSLASA